MGRTFRQSVLDYFTFLRNDRGGVITLIILIVLAIIGHVVISRMDLTPRTDFSEAKKALESWKNQNSYKKHLVLFEFDPNTVSEEELDRLDVPELVKRNFLKYRSAGGIFLKPADFRKIYGMNDSLYAKLEPFIGIKGDSVKFGRRKEYQIINNTKPAFTRPNELFPQNERIVANDSPSPGETSLQKEILLIELNSADSAELTRLYGIGPVFASRIIKYRSLLGGYHSPKQLLEVYGFSEEILKLIQQYVIADTSYIKPLRINFDDYRDLIRHPYLDKQEVEAILNYRSRNGPFTSTGQILRYGLLDSSAFAEIKPYLTCR
jgi:DNA uptake protein ComE-like DNA-binding protein